ncbi:MAG TPA: hypothetical protein PKN95_11515 [Verrucomicrobiota bacterium]|nr:hypothetical protein [Verrucomicrobiota bacterium]HNT15278.1 hypothetical protein [Verrucomicrobiota bacterium]
MRTPWLSPAAAAIVTLLSCGCHREPTPESSVSDLEKAFPAAPAAIEHQPVVNSSPSQPAEVDALVQSAVAAARANDYARGVITLQNVQTRPGITASQVEAVQRAKQAMVADLQRRAESGDAQALAQLKAIEKSRSQ